MAKLMDLPDEILLQIFLEMSPEKIFLLAQTCRALNNIAREPAIWSKYHAELTSNNCDKLRANKKAFASLFRHKYTRIQAEIKFLKDNIIKLADELDTNPIEFGKFLEFYNAQMLEIRKLDKVLVYDLSGNFAKINKILDEINLRLCELQVKYQVGYQKLFYITRLPAIFIERHIEHFAKLQILDLSKSFLDSLPNNIVECQNLYSLNLYHNPIVELPLHFGTLERLEHLYMSDGHMPYLPKSLYQLYSLKYFSCINMGLVEISSDIEDLYYLTSLNISDNKISKLPPELFDLKFLKEMCIENNRFSKLQGKSVVDLIKRLKMHERFNFKPEFKPAMLPSFYNKLRRLNQQQDQELDFNDDTLCGQFARLNISSCSKH